MLSTNKDINKNLRDINPTLCPPLSGEGWERLSYTKTQKLITALYMVTDIMDKEEPIRNKLRTLGLEVLSDPEGIRPEVGSYGAGTSIRRIEQIISLLDIASAMNFISEMNRNILKKEFFELKRSIQESTQVKPMWLEGFLEKEFPPLLNKEGVGGGNSLITTSPFGHSSSTRRRESNSKGHTRLGVQKGSTLLQALSRVEGKAKKDMSDRNSFNLLKEQRRADIMDIIKNNGGNVTIKDIRTNTTVQGRALNNVSEKTLQRELMSMTKSGVLYKEGSKRWSRYFVKN